MSNFVRSIRLMLIGGLVAAFAATCFGAHAAEESRKSENAFKKEFASKQSRMELAGNWLAKFRKYNDAIPTLSPAEKAWLEEEYDRELVRVGGRFSQRAYRARESDLYQMREAKEKYSSYVFWLNNLVRTDLIEEEEAYYWGALATDLMNRHGHQALASLILRGVVKIDGVDVQKSCPQCFVASQQVDAWIIMYEFIAPYLERGARR